MIPTHDIIWLAGLLEGEGAFMLQKISKGRSLTPAISLKMTDHDVVERASRLLGRAVYSWDRPDGHKRVHITGATGPHAASWMMTLYPTLGMRRRAKIREILSVWRSRPRGNSWKDKPTRYAACHPVVKHFGNGLCKRCYATGWNRARRARIRIAVLHE